MEKTSHQNWSFLDKTLSLQHSLRLFLMKKKILLLLFVVYAMLFTMSTYAQKSLPTISITTS
ncbi:MAG: hypothetical protein IIT63_11050, partial [Prevotella sp.]|nr:hypothetical protein [Prevotella sp.]